MKSFFGSTVFVIYFVGLNALQEECSDNTECSSQNAVCLDSKCQCDSLSYSTSNNSLCLSYVTEYNAICYEDNQCQWVGDNSGCRNNQCICNEGYRWYQGKCQNYSPKGGSCTTADDCYDGYNMLALTCKSNKCACNSGYYERDGDCRVSSSINGECAINDDCKPILIWSSICGLGKCVSPPSTTIEVKESMSMKILSTIEGRNSLSQEHNTIVAGSLPATSEDDCTTLYNNTMWYKDTTCVCQRGFFLLNGVCTAELGMLDPHVTYTADKECPIKPGKLKNKICYCKDFWFDDATNRECIKTTLQKTLSCMNNEWCRAMGPYAFCNSTTSQCECNSFATFDNTTFYCKKPDEVEVNVCLKDSECPINERCLNEKCDCDEKFTRSEDGICLPEIGGSCAFHSCSHIGNSSCVDDVCTCRTGFIGQESKCYMVADDLNESCEIEEQCQNLKNAVCEVSESGQVYNSTEKTCICDRKYRDINGTCYQTRRYGDLCSTKQDCTIVINESFECRKNLCQCPVSYKLTDGYCSVSSKITSSIAFLFTFMLMPALNFQVQNVYL